MIEVRKLNKTYDRHRVGANHVLHDVSFTLPDTGFVCILGPSGCGKTSLLNAMGGLDAFDNGSLITEDVQVSRYGTALYERERNRNFGYIFQNYYLLSDHSVAYNVYLGLHSLDLTHGEKLERVKMALKAVDMERYIRRRVGELSGGQQQRVAIARALARRPKVIFADEPTGNLDEANTRNICTLLRRASRESLVIMVTHEERIARFFADRIITLDEGRIVRQDENWDRESLSVASDKVIYAGDYAQTAAGCDGVSLRLLRQEGAPEVELTVVALKDRVVIRLADSRAVTVSTADDTVKIEEGSRPVMTLESVDRSGHTDSDLFAQAPARECKAGKGITGKMMHREARTLMKGKGAKRAGLRIFLVLLTVLALIITGDFVAISRLDPEDFIKHDSHILQLDMSRGDNTDSDKQNTGNYDTYWRVINGCLEDAGLEVDLVPSLPSLVEYETNVFYQMSSEMLRMPTCSHVPVEYLDESTLLYGRLPQSSTEIVVDRQVLEAALEMDGVAQKSISDITVFLNKELVYGKRDYRPTVVGICDSGERSIYISKIAMLSLSSASCAVITLSELQAQCPGKYDDMQLSTALVGDSSVPECVVFLNNAGMYYKTRIGQMFRVGSDQYYYIKDVCEEPSVQADIVVADEMLDSIINGLGTKQINIYCPDKTSVLAQLRHLLQEWPLEEISPQLAAMAEAEPELSEGQVMEKFMEENPQQVTDQMQLQYWVRIGLLSVKITDPYGQTYAAYKQAASVRADGRTIVIYTVAVLSLVMLYLLCRAQVQERLELLAVYRLLGIPGKKLYGIFFLEGLFAGLRTVIPAAVLTWGAVQILAPIPELELDLVLPWQVAAIVSVGILCYYLAVSLLPLLRLLRLPPAQLAAKYDL